MAYLSVSESGYFDLYIGFFLCINSIPDSETDKYAIILFFNFIYRYSLHKDENNYKSPKEKNVFQYLLIYLH